MAQPLEQQEADLGFRFCQLPGFELACDRGGQSLQDGLMFRTPALGIDPGRVEIHTHPTETVQHGQHADERGNQHAAFEDHVQPANAVAAVQQQVQRDQDGDHAKHGCRDQTDEMAAPVI